MTWQNNHPWPVRKKQTNPNRLTRLMFRKKGGHQSSLDDSNRFLDGLSKEFRFTDCSLLYSQPFHGWEPVWDGVGGPATHRRHWMIRRRYWKHPGNFWSCFGSARQSGNHASLLAISPLSHLGCIQEGDKSGRWGIRGHHQFRLSTKKSQKASHQNHRAEHYISSQMATQSPTTYEFNLSINYSTAIKQLKAS